MHVHLYWYDVAMYLNVMTLFLHILTLTIKTNIDAAATMRASRISLLRRGGSVVVCNQIRGAASMLI